MRVLIVHNRYRSAMPSGENRVVDDDIAMLRDAGVEVATYMRSSDEIDEYGLFEKAALLGRPIYSRSAARELRELIDGFRPDVVHLHNPFPLISPWAVRVAKRAGVPVVQTVHNYRHRCPAGTFFRDGHVCEDCAGKAVPWPAVMHGCYRDSRAQSAVMATAAMVNRQTWTQVGRYLAVSDFVSDHLRRFGIDDDRISVTPNSVPDPGKPSAPGNGFLFAGRLDIAKGVVALLDAWRLSGASARTTLAIAGRGDCEGAVRRAVAADPSIRFLGLLSPDELRVQLERCAIVVVPSLCHETFGLAAAEALSFGRPVLATRMGGLPSLIDPTVGWLVEPDSIDIARGLRCGLDAELTDLARNARHRYSELLSPNVVLQRLLANYEAVLSAHKRLEDG